MLDTPTVIITGAGASVPYKFPTTEQLRRDILASQTLLRQWYVHDLEKKQGTCAKHDALASGTVKPFIKDFRYSLAESIDQFLNDRPQYDEIGRAAIAAAILKYHRYIDDTISDNSDWLGYLLNRMADGCGSYHRFCENNVSFITFNYDRIIENSIRMVCCHRFGEKVKIEDIDNRGIPFAVCHIYGKVSIDGDDTMKDNDWLQLNIDKSIPNLHIVSNDRRPCSKHLTDVLASAKHVIVVGFGWNPSNIQQIPWAAIPTTAKVDLGAYEIPAPVFDRAKTILQECGLEHAVLNDHEANFTRNRMSRPKPIAIWHARTALQLLREKLGLLSTV